MALGYRYRPKSESVKQKRSPIFLSSQVSTWLSSPNSEMSSAVPNSIKERPSLSLAELIMQQVECLNVDFK